MSKPSKILSYFYNRDKNIGPVTDTFPTTNNVPASEVQDDNDLKNKARIVQQGQLELLLRKNAMYGSDNIALGQSDMTDVSNIQDSLISIAVRMRDKVNRLNQIMKNFKSEDLTKQEADSLKDTLDDIANYAVIARIVQQGKWTF